MIWYWLAPVTVIVYLFVLGLVASMSRMGDEFAEEDILAGIFWPVIGAFLVALAPIWLVIQAGVWTGELPGRRERKADERRKQQASDLERTRKIIAELEAANGIGDEC